MNKVDFMFLSQSESGRFHLEFPATNNLGEFRS